MAAALPRAGAAAAARTRRPGSGLPLRRSVLAARGPFFSSEAAPTPAPAAAAAGAEEDGDDLRGRIFRLGLAKRSATAALENGPARAAPAATSTPSRFGSQLNNPLPSSDCSACLPGFSALSCAEH